MNLREQLVSEDWNVLKKENYNRDSWTKDLLAVLRRGDLILQNEIITEKNGKMIEPLFHLIEDEGDYQTVSREEEISDG